MGKLRSSMALLITLVNAFGGAIILILIMRERLNYSHYRSLYEIDSKAHTNLRGTKIKIMEGIKSEKNKNYDPSYYTEEEFVLPKLIN